MMKVLIVCSFNSGEIAPFVKEQVYSLERIGVDFEYYKVEGKGTIGYLKNLKPLKQKIKEGKYDLVHAHYGLCAILANLQRIVPVVSTFHGFDVTDPKNNVLSSIAGKLSVWSIYVSQKLYDNAYFKPMNHSIIPCGIHLDEMVNIPRKEAREKLGMDLKKKYVLFSSAFNRSKKNSPLAKEAISHLNGNTELVELKGYSREEVALLMNACDLLLMTSFSEGSPQVVKEAMACGTPVISTDVGDVEEVVKNTENCYMVDYNAGEIAQKINAVFKHNSKTDGRAAVQRFDNHVAATEIKKVYEKIL